MGTHYFTSIAANYLPKARVLCESIRKFDPAATIHAVWNDAVPEWLDVASEPFQHLIRLEDLGVPNLSSWVFQHDLVELSTAVKGYALQRILARHDCDRVIYFDPDIVVLAPLDELLAEFAECSVLLTPHLSQPETNVSAVRDNELSVLRHGVFNLGFLGVKNSPEGHRFARWWTERLSEFCFDDIPAGLFTDQRWADLVPAFFPDHKVLRDPVYNLATWNLTSRTVVGKAPYGLTIDGRPLVFAHFSGLDSGAQLGMLERYGGAMPALFELREWYLSECDRLGDGLLSSLPWAYGFFSNGEPIRRSQREVYRCDPELQARYPDPFHSFPVQTAWIKPEIETAKPGTYRIFLIATPADMPYLDMSLARLESSTYQKDQLWLVAPSLTRDVQSIALQATRYEDFAAHLLQNFADIDMILVRAGAITPPLWDLRLAWTVARQPSAITVAPVDRRLLDEAGLFASWVPEEVDRLAYFYRQNDELETTSFSPDCVYIRSSALGEVHDGGQLRLSDLIDNAARRRWQHLMTTHICVSFGCPRRDADGGKTSPAKQLFLRELRDQLGRHAEIPELSALRNIAGIAQGCILHIAHSWGGGVEQWLRSFCQTDETHRHLILKSAGPDGMFGGKFELYRSDREEDELLRTWTLEPGIRASAVSHNGYRQMLSELASEFPIGRIIVSSLIGHSLDCLRSSCPTIFVCHDYYPYCSAINLTFGETCRSCEAPRLQACLEENPLNSNFPNVACGEWLVLRSEFRRAITQHSVTMVAPSHSVKENYLRLAPELATSFRVIPHGLDALECQPRAAESAIPRPLRVLLLGSLIPHKGRFLLEALLEELLSFAELTLAGCKESGEVFAANPKIRVIPVYQRDKLASLVAEVAPDLGLVLSVVPESFSYTVHELQSLCIPPLATDMGAFQDAIEEGITGFLCEAQPQLLLQRMRHLAAHPAELTKVRENLSHRKPRSMLSMVTEYLSLASEDYSAELYFSGPHAPDTLPAQAMQLFWREEGKAFSEENSYRFAPYHLNRQTALLYVPPARTPIAHLRFDPGASFGLLELGRLTLYTSDGRVLWSSLDCLSLLQSAPHRNIFPLSRILLCTTGDDPQIELPLSPEVLAELSMSGGHLAVDVDWHSFEAHVGELLSGPEAMFGDLVHDLATTREQLRKTQSVLAEAEAQVAAQSHELELSRNHSDNLAAGQKRMADSLSWKVTKPLRLAGELRRKLGSS